MWFHENPVIVMCPIYDFNQLLECKFIRKMLWLFMPSAPFKHAVENKKFGLAWA